MVVMRAESGGVTASRSYNIAAERQTTLRKKEVFVGKKCSMGSDSMSVLREQLHKSFLIGTLVHCKQ